MGGLECGLKQLLSAPQGRGKHHQFLAAKDRVSRGVRKVVLHGRTLGEWAVDAQSAAKEKELLRPSVNWQNVASRSWLSNSALGLHGNNLILYVFPFSFFNLLLRF